MGAARPLLTAAVRDCFDGRPDEDHVRVNFRLRVRGGWATVVDPRADGRAEADPLAACVLEQLRALRLPGGEVDFETPVADDFIAWEVRERGR